MGFLTGWIINIIIFLLLAMIIDMLLPESSMKKYAKLVTGLLLMAIIITPIFKIMSTDFDEVLASLSASMDTNEQSQENLLETKKREIQASTHAYILEQMAVQMKVVVEKELMEKFGMSITSIEITAKANVEPTAGGLQGVKVYIEPAKEEITAIEPVKIDINEDSYKGNTVNYESIRSTLATRWEIPESIIEIVPKGGSEKE